MSVSTSQSIELFDIDATMEALEGLFLLMRTVGTHGVNHPTALQVATKCAGALAAAEPPYSLEFALHCVFRDQRIISLDLSHYQRSLQLGQAMRNLGVGELTVETRAQPADLLRLGEALASAAAAPNPRLLDGLYIEGLLWRDLDASRWGVEGEELDPETMATTQITLAIIDAELVLASAVSDWPYPGALSAVRRLERADAAHRVAAQRTLEMAPGQWSIARRAVSATFHACSILRTIGVSPSRSRATAHATLGLALMGFRDRSGLPLHAAAARLLPLLLASPVLAKSGVDPHRLRVCSVVNEVARSDPDKPKIAVLELVRLLYGLELLRRPKELNVDLALQDLLGQALQTAKTQLETGWVRALIQVCGELPPGACVALGDGNIGAVIGPSADPSRPEVMVDGMLVVPNEPVRLLSAVPAPSSAS